MANTINYKFGDIQGHSMAVKLQAQGMEGIHQQINKHVQEIADMWGGQGSAEYQNHITAFNQAFNQIHEAANKHAQNVSKVADHMSNTDAAVAGSWA